MFLWPWINFFSMTISWPVATMLLPANVERLLDVLFKFVDVEVLFRELHCKYVNEQSLAKLISVPPRPLTNCLYFTYFIFHRRPATSFLWFTSPLKTLRYIIWGRYKWYIIGFLLFVIIALLIVLFFYSAPVSFITNQLMIWSLETNHEVFTGKATVKRAAKNVQLVLKYCCKTSWIAIMRVLPHKFELVLQQLRLQGFISRGEKRATSLFNSFWSKVAKQVARFSVGHFTLP